MATARITKEHQRPDLPSTRTRMDMLVTRIGGRSFLTPEGQGEAGPTTDQGRQLPGSPHDCSTYNQSTTKAQAKLLQCFLNIP